MALINLGFNSAFNPNQAFIPSLVGQNLTPGKVNMGQSSQLEDLLAKMQSQIQAGQQPTQLGQMQALTGMSPGGQATGNPGGPQMQGGPSGMPGNPGGMSPGQMLQQPGQAAQPPIGGGATGWPGMNGPNTDPTATSYPGQGSPMAQLPGTMNPQLVTSGLGLLAALAGNNKKNAAANAPAAQSQVMRMGGNGAMQRLLQNTSLGGLLGANGG